jgi:hypothetical protein
MIEKGDKWGIRNTDGLLKLSWAETPATKTERKERAENFIARAESTDKNGEGPGGAKVFNSQAPNPPSASHGRRRPGPAPSPRRRSSLDEPFPAFPAVLCSQT